MGYFESESTFKKLVIFIKETENAFNEALSEVDPNAFFRIYPSLDLCFPHDLQRIAGGFPTGIYLNWDFNQPFIPVDTTVNVCTSSVFKLSDNFIGKIDETFFNNFFREMEDSSYQMNFHRGNHFISFSIDEITNEAYLILHSSAQEFKKQFNGLFPVPGNWFYDDIIQKNVGSRMVRFLIGKKAELFYKIASSLDQFNRIRHDFFAELLVRDHSSILNSIHKHHYGMPNSNSIIIGSFLLERGETAPLFTFPGMPIFLIKTNSSKLGTFTIENTEKYLVPHGWGKKSIIEPEINIDLESMELNLNGIRKPIDINSSLRDHPHLQLRKFSVDSDDPNNYFEIAKEYISIEIEKELIQYKTWSKQGFKNWK